ncbi:peptidoglycan-binding protein [Actinomadura sp. GC306]|uniref:peptidoglycan-binding domain-containing protein n=1 Tax=Actinomadura sp. GC306 TaxID=2530367 RepID=UPI00105221BB|nr:peptidoglycan-binding domain-containing protein [Actinomadura sp. GC306]TDC67311.1 peptidoglycan-binding protein [Actinomadura sp. GC306]
MFKPAIRTIVVLSSTLTLAAGVLSVPASADEGAQARLAALPSCTHFSARKVQNGAVRFPSVGANTLQRNCKLQQGDHNWGVVALQQWLLYCNGAKQVEVDGIYGPVTRDVITWIQAVKGLTVDGIYGPETSHALEKTVFVDNKVVGCV